MLVSLVCLYFRVTLSVRISSFACLVEQDKAVTLLYIPHAVLLRAVHEIVAVIPETLLVLLRRRHGNSLTRQERCLTFLLLACDAQPSAQVAAKTRDSAWKARAVWPENIVTLPEIKAARDGISYVTIISSRAGDPSVFTNPQPCCSCSQARSFY